MCLIFKNNKLPDHAEETITAYKLYRLTADSLASPHNSFSKHGVIAAPGTYAVEKPTVFEDLFINGLPSFESPVKCNLDELEFNPSYFQNHGISISGFHCFERKEDAENYHFFLTILGNDDFFHLLKVKYAVIPVTINKKDVFAIGKTSIPFGSRSYSTFVTTSITISEEDFRKALAKNEPSETNREVSLV